MLCPLPSDFEPLGSARPVRREPHQLHWRQHPPHWHGDLGQAYKRLYPHLVDSVCCFQCGGTPCDFDHEADKRMRLQDLEFVKELAKERRELKELVDKLKAELEQATEEASGWEMDRLMFQAQITEYEKMKKAWEQERTMLEAEVRRLKALTEGYLDQISEYRKDRQKLVLLQQRLEAVEEENKRLEEENKKFKQIIINQTTEINSLTQQRTELSRDLEEANHSIRRLRVELSESNETVNTLRKEVWEKEKKVQELETSITDLIKELETRTKLFEEKDLESKNLIDILRAHIDKLKFELDDSAKGNEELQKRIDELLLEIEILKRKLASDKRFHHFVEIKRECNDLKDQNEVLKYTVFEHAEHTAAPVMKPSGKVTAHNSYVPSTHIRPISALLQRPKTARAGLRPHATDSSTS